MVEEMSKKGEQRKAHVKSIMAVLTACAVALHYSPVLYPAAGVDTQGQLGEKAAEFKKIFRDEVCPDDA